MFKLEIWETPLCLAAAECIDLFVDSNFTTAGINMVNWWLYEDADKVIFSDSEEPIDISRLEDFGIIQQKIRILICYHNDCKRIR